MDLVDELLGRFKKDITEIKVIPSSGGVFEVAINEQLVFSKKDLGRFPEPGEILEKIY